MAQGPRVNESGREGEGRTGGDGKDNVVTCLAHTLETKIGGEGDGDGRGDHRDTKTGESETQLIGIGYADGSGLR